MKAQRYFKEEQLKELLAYLGVSKRSVGWCCILSCFTEISGGRASGMEVYEHVALQHGKTVAQVVRSSLCALEKARQKKPREWEEIFPQLGMSLSQAGLTVFLCRAAEWLRRNKIEFFYLGHVKCRRPVSQEAAAPDPAAQ